MQHQPQRRTGAGERKTRMRAPAPPAKKSNGLVIGIAAGAVLLVCVLGALAMKGGDKPGDDLPVAPPPPIAKAAPPPVAPPPAPPPPPPAPVSIPEPAPIPDEKNKYEKQAEERHKLLERQVSASNWNDAEKTHESLVTIYKDTKYVVANRAAIDALGERVRAKPMPGYDAYVKRVEKRIKEGHENVARAKEAIQRSRKQEAEYSAAAAKRLAGRTFALRQRGGPTLTGATVVAAGRDLIKVRVGSGERELAWRMIDDKSLLELAKAIYADQGAPGLYELGRICFDQRLWKEAKDAWQKCVKADKAREKRIPFAPLEKLIRGEGAFRGTYKVTGGDTVSIIYDFTDENQAKDFEARGEGVRGTGEDGLALAADDCFWTLKELDFAGDVAFEASVSIDEGGWVAFSLMRTWDGNGYEVLLGHTARIDRVDGRLDRTTIVNGTGTFAGKAEVKVTQRNGTIKAFVNGREVMSASDDKYKQGWCGIGALRARAAVYRKLTVTGKVDREQLEKQGSDAEVDARRILESIEEGGVAVVAAQPLSAEDEYFMGQLSRAQRDAYDTARVTAAAAAAGMDLPPSDLGRARAALRAIIREAPDFAAARYWRLEMVQRDMGRGRREAEEEKEDIAALEKRTDFPEGQALVAEYQGGKLTDSLRFAEAALKSMPDNAPSISLRGIVRFMERDTQGGLEDLELAARLAPLDREVRLQYQAVLWSVRGAESFGARHRAETKHYVVVTDTSEERAKLYAERLEVARAHYMKFFSKHFREDPKRPKARVAVFSSKEGYYSYSQLTSESLDRPENALGHFSPLLGLLLLFEATEEADTLDTLYHEAVHQFVDQMARSAPIWWNEGMAEYLASIKIEKGVVVKTGLLQEKRLKVLQEYLDYTLPFERIMNESNGLFMAVNSSLKYAQAWSMLHFFYEHAGGRHRPLIEKYWDCVARGMDRAAAFKETFGSVSLRPIEQEWRKYVAELK